MRMHAATQMLGIAAKCFVRSMNFEIQIAHIVTRCVGDRIGSILTLNGNVNFQMDFSQPSCVPFYLCFTRSAVQLPLLFGPAPCCFLFFYQCRAVVVVDVVIETNIHLRAHLLYFANWIPKRIGSLICEKKRFEIQRISIKIQSTCIPSKLFVTQCHMKPVSNDSLMPLLDMINNTVNSKKQKPKMFEILFRRFDSIRFNWIRARYV